MSNVNWGAQDASKFYICGIWEMALDLISDGGYFDIRRKARPEEEKDDGEPSSINSMRSSLSFNNILIF